MYIWTGSCFLVIYHIACNWISSQVVNVLLVGPVQLFPFPWYFQLSLLCIICWHSFTVFLTNIHKSDRWKYVNLNPTAL